MILKSRIIQWLACTVVFALSGLIISALMSSLLDTTTMFRSALSIGVTAGTGMCLAWLASWLYRRSRVLYAAAVMGVCSGVTGVCGVQAIGYLVSSLLPWSGITDYIP